MWIAWITTLEQANPHTEAPSLIHPVCGAGREDLCTLFQEVCVRAFCTTRCRQKSPVYPHIPTRYPQAIFWA